MYTFDQPLGRAVSVAAGSPAVVCQDSRRTYAELGSRCRRLAGAMRKLGVAPHDRVGVIAANSDRYLELYLGLGNAEFGEEDRRELIVVVLAGVDQQFGSALA